MVAESSYYQGRIDALDVGQDMAGVDDAMVHGLPSGFRQTSSSPAAA
jgi:hypothetical protein